MSNKAWNLLVLKFSDFANLRELITVKLQK